MYNVLQPYINLTHSNIEALSRFANAREITDATKESAIRFVQVAQENLSKIAASNAFSDLTRTAVDNYVRFANEYTQQVYGIIAQGQEFVSRQVEEGNRRFAQIADISSRAVEAGTQQVKSATDEAAGETEQQLARARQQRSR
jgi:hypothetical protein